MLGLVRGWARRGTAIVARRVDRVIGPARLKLAATRRLPLKIVIGAAGMAPEGWTPTEARYLDMLRVESWRRFFSPATLDAILAEHVWEHLEPDDAQTAARMCFEYLRPGATIRVAVPDGNHPDPAYKEWVRPGGVGPGASGHRVLYTVTSLSSLFRSAGFEVVPLEYFDENGHYHQTEWRELDGPVWRSHFGRQRGAPAATAWSIIIDAMRPRSVSS